MPEHRLSLFCILFSIEDSSFYFLLKLKENLLTKSVPVRKKTCCKPTRPKERNTTRLKLSSHTFAIKVMSLRSV